MLGNLALWKLLRGRRDSQTDDSVGQGSPFADEKCLIILEEKLVDVLHEIIQGGTKDFFLAFYGK